ALLVLLMDNCVNARYEEAACNVFTPLEHTYRQSKDKLPILWVDIEGNAALARKIIRHNHLTFPVVNDQSSNSVKAWKYQAYPYWVLLDSRGRVIEARFKPQTLPQLRQLVREAR